MGSTRMPSKILLPFDGRRSILEIILNRIKHIAGDSQVIVATTTNENDELIVGMAEVCGVECYRGSESDVLSRFIDAAQAYGVDRLVRVCSDNPFLSSEGLQLLMQTLKTTDADYVGFKVGDKPSILTHGGFYAEGVTLSALMRVAHDTSLPLYHEHVTNYIYTHPDDFKICWLPADSSLANHPEVRLTIDTPQDFSAASQVFAALSREGDDWNISRVIDAIGRMPSVIDSMKTQIEQNSK